MWNKIQQNKLQNKSKKHNLKSIPQFNNKKPRRGLGFGNQDVHVQLTQVINGSIMHCNKCWDSWCVIDIRSLWQKYFHAQSTQEHNVNDNWYSGNLDYNIWNKVQVQKHKVKCGMDEPKSKTWGEQQLQQFVN